MARMPVGFIRCEYHYANGRQCRMARTSFDPPLCPTHLRALERKQDTCTLEDILKPGEPLEGAQDVFRLLANVLRQLAANRLSPRRAAVIAYTSQLMLNASAQALREARPTENGANAKNGQAGRTAANAKQPEEEKTHEQKIAESQEAVHRAVAEHMVASIMDHLKSQTAAGPAQKISIAEFLGFADPPEPSPQETSAHVPPDLDDPLVRSYYTPKPPPANDPANVPGGV
jgi:hypothetical protein